MRDVALFLVQLISLKHLQGREEKSMEGTKGCTKEEWKWRVTSGNTRIMVSKLLMAKFWNNTVFILGDRESLHE